MQKAKDKILSTIHKDESGCWLWLGYVQSNGYSRLTYNGKTQGAHRLSYAAFKGEIPDGMDVCHTCDVRHCVNPKHLFIGTRLDNMRDCKEKGRMSCGEKHSLSIWGEKAAGAKLTERQVVEIRQKREKGVRTKALSEEYGVSSDNIRRIIRRDTWRYV